MKVIFGLRGRWLLGALVLLGGAPFSQAGHFSSDFNSGTPAGATLNGTATVDTTGGSNNSGVLKLTTADNGQEGSLVLDDLDGGAVISGFTATFKLLIGGGSGADGFSFNFAPDLGDLFGEEGSGTGFTAEFDTYDNGGGEAPAIDLKNGGNEVITTTGVGSLLRQNKFMDVRIQVNSDGTASLSVDNQIIYTNYYGAFTPSAGRFGLGARTGGSTDNHWIDDLTIDTVTVPATKPAHPLVSAASPKGGSVNPDVPIDLQITDYSTAVDVSTVKLQLNGTSVSPTVVKTNTLTTVHFQPPALLPSNSTNTYTLLFTDSGSSVNTNQWTFSVIGYTNKVLPDPIYLEDFEQVTLGGIPAGWTVTNMTDNVTGTSDIGDPKSDAYLNWLVIDRNQVFLNGTNDFHVWEAGDPDGRVTHIAPGQVVNGKVLTAQDLMVDKFLYAESDERSGRQVQVVFTKDYDLTGKSDIYVSYHSSYIQNQDSMAVSEYSIDQGKTWLPIRYFMYGLSAVTSQDGSRIAYTTNSQGVVSVDALSTLTKYVRNGQVDNTIDPRQQNDTPQYDDGTYSVYGDFIEARPLDSLGPYIESRVNDDTYESHRVELYRLPAADNQKTVRLRLVQMGTGSWYWALDDIGFYSIPATGAPGAKFSRIAHNADGTFTLEWAGGGTLQAAPTVLGPWQDVTGAASPYTFKPTGAVLFGRIKQ